MTTCRTNKDGRMKEFYSEAYRFELFGGLLLKYLQPPNLIAAKECEHALNAALSGMAEYMNQLVISRGTRVRESNPEQFDHKAQAKTLRKIADDLKRFRSRTHLVRKNVWRG